ncbi:putative membrane-anchored protein [Oxalobacteraceae bacterium GrIS 1.11]
MTTLPDLSPRHRCNKVPQVAALFWLIKMMSTTVGETAADFLNGKLQVGLAGTTVVAGVLSAIALFFQMRARRYLPVRYWMTVVLISVFGTLITDNLSDQFGVPLAVSTGCFGAALGVTFFVWYTREKTLSIHTIDTIWRELFYWTAILLTFALGTAAGDWLAEGFGLGYANSALLFGGLIAATAFAHYVFKADAVTCFWPAYVLTRPFGASCGDLLSQPVGNGGLGLGSIATSAVFLVTISCLVAYLSAAQKRLHQPYNR